MSALISVFDIPHLLDSICHNLHEDDLARCRQVCQIWNTLFIPHFWMTQQIGGRKPLSDIQQSIVLDHAHLFRSLTVELNLGAFLAQPDSPCTRLRELTIYEPQRQQQVSSFVLDAESLPPVAVPLLKYNTGLRSLKLSGWGTLWNHLTQDMLDSLTISQSLTTVHLTAMKWIDPKMIPRILYSLPVSLEELKVILMETASLMDYRLDWGLARVLPKLAKIEFHLWDRTMGLPLLAKCPGLVDLNLERYKPHDQESLVTTILGCCSRMKFLSLKNFLRLEMAERLANGLKRLKMFRVGMVTDPLEEYPVRLIPSLIVQSGSTLCILELLGSIRVSIEDMCLVLGNCPGLKQLKLDCAEPVQKHPQARRVNLQDLVTVPWVCSRLELLGLDLSECMAELVGEDNVVIQTTVDTEEVQNAVFLQLLQCFGTLPRLGRVKLTWGRDGPALNRMLPGREILNFSYEQGFLVEATYGRLGDRIVHPSGIITPSALVSFLMQNGPGLKTLMWPTVHEVHLNCPTIHAQDLLAWNWSLKEINTLSLAITSETDSFDPLLQVIQRLNSGLLVKLSSVYLNWIFKSTGSVLLINFTMANGQITEFYASREAPSSFLGEMASYILSHCPALRGLELEEDVWGAEEPILNGSVPLETLLQSEWVCHALEMLDIRVIWGGEEEEGISKVDSCACEMDGLSGQDLDKVQRQQEKEQKAQRLMEDFVAILDGLPLLKKKLSGQTSGSRLSFSCYSAE